MIEPYWVGISFYGIHRETAAAFQVDSGGKRVWLPKSQIKQRGATTMVIPRWLACDKELSHFDADLCEDAEYLLYDGVNKPLRQSFWEP